MRTSPKRAVAKPYLRRSILVQANNNGGHGGRAPAGVLRVNLQQQVNKSKRWRQIEEARARDLLQISVALC